MAADIRNKEIQVQKPAQSLEHFQAKVASGDDLDTGMLHQLLLGVGAVALVGLGWVGINAYLTNRVEKHETAVAEILLKVQGDGVTPVPAAEAERLMREQLPRLEALAASAPGSRKAITQGLVSSWKLQLDGKTQALAADAKDPWGRLREAQALISKGDAAGAVGHLEPFRADAKPEAAWGQLWWTTRMEAHRLQGDRPQALKDLAEYKARFKKDADNEAMTKVVQGI